MRMAGRLSAKHCIGKQWSATAHHATYPKKKRWKAISQEAGRETRPAATGTIALPIPCGFVHGAIENVGKPFLVTLYAGGGRRRMSTASMPAARMDSMPRSVSS
jgi:hypothetical protein